MARESGGLVLGAHPESGLDVLLRAGSFGFYVQHGRRAEGGDEEFGIDGGRALGEGGGAGGAKEAPAAKTKEAAAVVAKTVKTTAKGGAEAAVTRVAVTPATALPAARQPPAGLAGGPADPADVPAGRLTEAALRPRLLSLEDAVTLLALPREVGGVGGGDAAANGDAGVGPIVVGVGRYGPYLSWTEPPAAPGRKGRAKYCKLPAGEEPLTVPFSAPPAPLPECASHSAE